MSRDDELEGQVALVTGAAGGVGQAVVAQLLAQGASVVAQDIDPVPPGDRVTAVGGDAADATVAEAGVRAALDNYGRLDILVNGAGRFLRKTILETSDDEWDALLATNVRSAFVHCRAAIPVFVAAGHGAIVSVGSTSGLIGQRSQGAYSVTKGALHQLMRQVAVEYGPAGVRANIVAPGAIDTDFVARSVGHSLPPRPVEEVEAKYPIGRIATPEEIAEAIVFLASPRASVITGAVLSADGGFTAQ